MSRLSSLKGLKNISWLTPAQLAKLAAALTVIHFDKRAIIFEEGKTPEAAYVLLSGVARITCRNRKGIRTMLIMVAPGMIPGFPGASPALTMTFAVRRLRAARWESLSSTPSSRFAWASRRQTLSGWRPMYVGRWDLVHLRCSNFMSCTLAERLALTLLELSENFGTPDRRGVRLTVPARHKNLAELVGASRPRVTEHLMAFERANMIVRTAGTWW